MRHSNNVLVLIQPALAGPDVNPLNYWQPQWVLWPPILVSSRGSRVLSVATGENWTGSIGDLRFYTVSNGWKARDYDDLKSRGSFEVRSTMIGGVRTALLVGDSGSASPNAMRIALNGDSPVVTPTKISDPNWPANDLMVAEASGWDQVAEIENSTTGRVLVVEYPPPANIAWSRYWLKGHKWKIRETDLEGTPETAVVPTEPGFSIPGLIRARQLISLVDQPDRFQASVVSLHDWPGANRFLSSVHTNGPYVDAFWMAAIVAVVIWGGVLVSNERSGHVLPTTICWAMLSPAIVVLAGLMGRFWGVDQWFVWLLLSSFGLTIAAMALSALARRKLDCAHPLLSIYGVGLATLCLVNPVWSFLSPVFNLRPSPVSYVAIAATLGYLAGIIGCLQGCGRMALWLGRGLVIAWLVGGLAMHAWWTEDLGTTLFIPVGTILAGESVFRWQMLIGFALWPSSLVALVAGGFIWAPLGLISNAKDRVGINLAHYVEFVTSPSLVIFLLLAGGISLFGYKFFFHQMRTLGKLDRRRLTLSYAALCGAAFGLLHPAFLLGSLVLATGALLSLLFDAVQTM